MRALSLQSVARYLDITSKELRKKINRGEFPAPAFTLPSGSPRWFEVDVMRWAGKDASPVRQKRDARAFVYFVRCGEFVKIGVADDPAERLKALQCANPELLELLRVEPGGFRAERTFHVRFAAHRVRPDSEWFRLTEEIRDYIAGHGGTGP